VTAEENKKGQTLIQTDEAMVDPVSHTLHDNPLRVSYPDSQGSKRLGDLSFSLPIGGENYLLNPSEQ
jgi:hypothetical protein